MIPDVDFPPSLLMAGVGAMVFCPYGHQDFPLGRALHHLAVVAAPYPVLVAAEELSLIGRLHYEPLQLCPPFALERNASASKMDRNT